MRVVELSASHVRVPLKKAIKHASHSRTSTDNVVVKCVLADGTTGYGEGVPRDYVTGETIDSALELLAARFLPEGVHFHSIIGVLPHPNHLLESVLSAAASREGTDGVVPYSSAHLEGVDSELIVPADHFHVHHHPLAVQEVRRILMEHLQTVNQMDGP